MFLLCYGVFKWILVLVSFQLGHSVVMLIYASVSRNIYNDTHPAGAEFTRTQQLKDQ